MTTAAKRQITLNGAWRSAFGTVAEDSDFQHYGLGRDVKHGAV